MANLSPELLGEIFSHFDTAPPSISKLRLQPHVDLASSPTVDLKTISCISWKWRLVALRPLFRHIRISLKRDEVSSWSLQVESMLRFLRRAKMTSIVESLTIVFTTTEGRRYSPGKQLPSDGVEGLFRPTFETLDPICLTLVAPPDTLGFLTSCDLRRPVLDHYHMPYQILSLTQPRRRDPSFIMEPKFSIFSIRPWSSVLLNEGSFIRAYSICGYPFTGTTPPSILPDLVSINSKTNKPVLPFRIREFSYIAMFPFSFHFHLLENLLPRLRKLDVQLVPRSDIAADPEQTAQALILDMIHERDNCYASLLRWVLDPHTTKLHRYLREIKCGDGDIEPAWGSHVARYSDFIRSSKITVQ